MPLPSLRDALGSGLVVSGWSSLIDPLVHEALLRAPFDAIMLDMQHGLHDLKSVSQAVAVAGALGKPAIVRVPVDDRATVSRALDLGASAVIMPMIETVEDARRFVSVAKYPPLGLRSYGPARALDVHGYDSPADYAASANRETLSFAMIETRAALDDLEAILAIDGLDGVFVGPSDLSIALAGDGTRNPESAECVAAIERVAKVAELAGKIAAIYAASVGEARRYRDFGYRLVCVSSDIAMLKAAAVDIAKAVRT
ncbi:HpcH/HpaI aldolase family protein [Aureimonas leprariae]|uniref:2,4-dihydroxyhept-2-ene-1,7-dioic acid aldolase n=1 Tax=Plantimonas leprariae TaxID=2615207 RepID=A0A7V7PR05_9HYPH|nr:aldolase/citrate lyase family protein [Aureimonas leprariae]KAB0680886.1 2,4-dihydroxyhept-2-ene-1,7-dioic acid aldolase [Aureimonas leprariae]